MTERDKRKPVESVIEVDVRGLACPEPVVRTKQTLESLPPAAGNILAVTTDSPESRDNIARFAERSGCGVTATEREPGVYVVEIRRAEGDCHPVSSWETGGCTPRSGSSPAPRAVLLISSDELGRGDEKLGRLLMTLFLRALPEIPARPGCLLLVNSGVRLALEGSEQLSSLKTLEQQGVTIRVCGTCLDFFGVKDRVRAGTVSNMYELAEMLIAGERLAVL